MLLASKTSSVTRPNKIFLNVFVPYLMLHVKRNSRILMNVIAIIVIQKQGN